MSDFRPPPRTKTILDLPKFRLTGDVQGGATARPTLSFYLTGENPRADVYTQISGDRDNGLIRAKLDYQALGVIFSSIEHFCLAETPADRWSLDCKDGYAYGKKQPTPVTTAQVVVGKDERGRIYLSVLDALNKDRAKIRFYFGLGEYFGLVNSQGQPVDEATISRMSALGWVEMYKAVMAVPATQQYEAEQVKKAAKAASGGNNNNRGGYQGNGGGRSAAQMPAADDDLNW